MSLPTKPKKVVFLDRDGTINVDRGYIHRVADWQFTKGAVTALRLLREDGFILTVVTNQSGIAHNLYSLAAMEKTHAYLTAELKKAGVNLAAIAFCPHSRAGTCDCRKPATGMIKQINQQLGAIDFARSWTIGDKLTDFELGRNALTRTALITSRYWLAQDLAAYPAPPDLVANSLLTAARKITNHPTRPKVTSLSAGLTKRSQPTLSPPHHEQAT